MLYFLSLTQINFWYDKSTARTTIRVDSIALSRIDNIFNSSSKPSCAIFSKSHTNRLPVWQIDSKGDDLCQFERIESNWRHFQPTLKPSFAIFSKSCKNRLPVWRIDSKGDNSRRLDQIESTIRSNRVESTTFLSHPQSPVALYFVKFHTNRLPVWQINSKGDDLCQFDRVESNWQHLQPTLHSPHALYWR